MHEIILILETIIRIMRLIHIMIHIFSGNCPTCNIGAARIGQTQGPFCTVQFFGAGAHQVQGSTAGFVPLFQPWKHMMILKQLVVLITFLKLLVLFPIMQIMHIIAIISIIAD